MTSLAQPPTMSTEPGSRSRALTRRHRLRVEASPLTCGRCGHLLEGGRCAPCNAQAERLARFARSDPGALLDRLTRLARSDLITLEDRSARLSRGHVTAIEAAEELTELDDALLAVFLELWPDGGRG